MKKHPFKEALNYGPMKLQVWQTAGCVQVAIGSISSNRFEQMKLAFQAASKFGDHVTQDEYRGTLLDISQLEALLTACDLGHLLVKTPAKTPSTSKPDDVADVTPKIKVRSHATREIRPQQIYKLYELMKAGHSQAYASALSGIGESTASLLRRGKLKTKLRPELQAAMAATFEQANDLQSERVKVSNYAVDERNASLIPKLYQLVHLKGSSIRGAAKLLDIDASLAQKLTTKSHCGNGPKSQHAWQSNFGNKPAKPTARQAKAPNRHI